MQELPATIFDSLKKLGILNLANNKLETIPKALLNELTKLQRLKLTGNIFEKRIPADRFKNLSKDIHIELEPAYLPKNFSSK